MRPQPATVHRAISAALLARLAVLRSPAGATERGGGLEAQGMTGVLAGSLRLARVLDGRSYYVFVARSSSLGGYYPSLACLRGVQARLRRELPRIPVALRAAILAFARYQVDIVAAEVRQSRLEQVCLAYRARLSSGAECGVTASELGRLGGFLTSPDLAVGIVPDGVATVTLRYPRVRPSRGVRRRAPLTVTAAVIDNVYAARVPGLETEAGPGRSAQTIVWRSATGAVVRRIHPLALAALCARNPVTCAITAGGEALSEGSATAAATHVTAVRAGSRAKR